MWDDHQQEFESIKQQKEPRKLREIHLNGWNSWWFDLGSRQIISKIIKALISYRQHRDTYKLTRIDEL